MTESFIISQSKQVQNPIVLRTTPTPYMLPSSLLRVLRTIQHDINWSKSVQKPHELQDQNKYLGVGVGEKNVAFRNDKDFKLRHQAQRRSQKLSSIVSISLQHFSSSNSNLLNYMYNKLEIIYKLPLQCNSWGSLRFSPIEHIEWDETNDSASRQDKNNPCVPRICATKKGVRQLRSTF